jgi:hypothetical protein
MTLPDLPSWLWAFLAVESLGLGWLAFRFGLRGFAWGALAALVFWCVLSLGGSFLVSRLEGSRPGDLLPGAVLGVARIAAFAAPMGGLAGVAGLLLRRLFRH